MNTAAILAQIKKLHAIFGFLALLNLSGNKFPEDATCDGKTYDYLIVGGGSAGVVLAARLVEANYSVLVIEAGANPDLETKYPGLVPLIKGSRMDWNFTPETSSNGNECRIGNGSIVSGKVLGGSGATNYMIYQRAFSRDFESIAKTVKDSSWNWKNMLKYFKKSEKLVDNNVLKSPYGKYHGTKGKIGVTKENRPSCQLYLKGFKQAGEPVVEDNIGAGILGYSTALYRILDGYRTEGACAYLTPLKNNPKLQITRNSVATKIIFDKNKNAVGVTFVKDGKTITVKASKEVIITAGPIKSPQLLMLSGVGPKKELKNMNINVLSDLPVGKNLRNSEGALLVFRTNKSADSEPFYVHNYPTKLIVGHSALNKSSRDPDYLTYNHFLGNANYFLKFCAFTLGFKNSICDKFYSLIEKKEMLFTIVSHSNPKSYGEIKLRSTDPLDQPKIINGYFTNDNDVEELASYVMDYIKIEKTPHFQSLGLECLKPDICNKFKLKSRAYWKCYVLCMSANFSNKCGTCAMGSVVDSKLKVMGVNRLRVVDASVIPVPIGSQIYDTVVATAEKAADMIKGEK